MKITLLCTLPLCLFLLFSSCEKIPLPSELEDSQIDQNISSPVEEVVIDSKQAIAKPAISDPVKPDKKITPPPEPPPPPLMPPPAEPQEPVFSEDLLAAVKNWTRIPKSVFPASPILSTETINLVAKTSSGQIIGNSITPPGTELQALGLNGDTLIVANINNNRLRGEVNIDQTDFKQLLAYRFELYKRREAEKKITQSLEISKDSPKATDRTDVKNSEEIDQIPDPLDFGHGRFCICKDCREKRLSKTGSLKTGFGIEP